jgi:hypothetical protein
MHEAGVACCRCQEIVPTGVLSRDIVREKVPGGEQAEYFQEMRPGETSSALFAIRRDPLRQRLCEAAAAMVEHTPRRHRRQPVKSAAGPRHRRRPHARHVRCVGMNAWQQLNQRIVACERCLRSVSIASGSQLRNGGSFAAWTIGPGRAEFR